MQPVSSVRHTARLRLSPIGLYDLGALIEIEGDPATNQHRPAGPPTDDEVEQYLRGFIQAWALGGVGYWSVEHGGDRIGVAGLRPLVFRGRDCWKLYYRLRPSA